MTVTPQKKFVRNFYKNNERYGVLVYILINQKLRKFRNEDIVIESFMKHGKY